MRTKEEILQDKGEEKYGKPQYDGFRIDYAHNKDADFIFKAMDEYADEMIIEYENWKKRNGIWWNTENAPTPAKQLLEKFKQEKK